MKDKKGFTLIEMLTAVIIISVLLLVIIPSIWKYIKKGTTEYYSSLENMVLLAGRDYLNDYKALYPKEIGNVTVINLDELENNKYIKDVVDTNGDKCSAMVTVKKTDKNNYEYYSCLLCSDYKSKDSNCNYNEDENITSDTKNYVVEVDANGYEIDANGYYIVDQGNDFSLPYGKVYKTNNNEKELIDDKLVPRPKTVDTNKLGITAVSYVYKGAKKEITVKVVDRVKPSTPQVVLRYDNSNGNLYNGGWYSGDIYQEYLSTDYAKPGLLGSGVKEYQFSKDGKSYTVLAGNNRIETENGEHIYYVKSKDKSEYENISDPSTYVIKIDKEIPSCKLVSSGTKGKGTWYISDSKVSFKEDEIIEKVSSIIDKNIDNTKITEDVKNKVVTGQVVDEANNIGYCRIEVSVDKTNPQLSYNLSNKIYNSNQTLTITASDKFYDYMDITNNKDGKVINNDTVKSNSKSYTLTHGTYTVNATADDESGRNTSLSKSYVIDTKAPTCSLEVDGTKGNDGWYTSYVTVGFKSTDGTGSKIVSYKIKNTSVNKDGKISLNYNTTGEVVTAIVTDEAGNVGTCKTGTIKIDTVVPNAPTITASDNISSGNWHTNNFDLKLSGANNISGNSYYFNNTNSNINNLYNSKIEAYNETTGYTYYTKVCSKAGLCSGVSSYQVKLDKTDPTCSLKVTSGTLGDNNWYTSNVNVGFNSYEDNISGISSFNIDKTSITSDGNTKITGTVKDNAGRSNTCSINVYIDKTKPTCSLKVTSGTLGNNNWYTSNVNVGFNSYGDSTSGISSYSIDKTSITSDGETKITGTVKDNAGNTNYCYTNVKVDKTKPTIDLSKIPQSITISEKYNVPTNVTYGVSGGTTTCKIGNTNITNTESLAIGKHTISCTATSNAGLSQIETKEITVDQKCVVTIEKQTQEMCFYYSKEQQEQLGIDCSSNAINNAIKEGIALNVKVNEAESYTFLVLGYNVDTKILRLMCVDDRCVVPSIPGVSQIQAFNKTMFNMADNTRTDHPNYDNWTNCNALNKTYRGFCYNNTTTFHYGRYHCGDNNDPANDGVSFKYVDIPYLKDDFQKLMPPGSKLGDIVSLKDDQDHGWISKIRSTTEHSALKTGTYLIYDAYTNNNYEYFPMVFAYNCNGPYSCIGFGGGGSWGIMPVIEITTHIGDEVVGYKYIKSCS